MVAIPSLSTHEQERSDWVARQLADAGLAVQKIGDNVVVEIGSGEGPVLMLASHLDTVPAGEGWHQNPYRNEWQQGKLVALGANDAGASVAAMCATISRLACQPLSGTLRLALVVEEETSNAGMAQVLETVGLPDMAVIGEPTGLEVVRVQAGLAILKAQWKGQSCHAANAPQVEHQNALLQACGELAALPSCHQFESSSQSIHGLRPTSVVPAVLNSGDRHNRVPDSACATFDVRLSPPQSAADVADWLQEQLPTAQVEVVSDRLRPIDTCFDHPLVQQALAMNGRSEAIASSTMSDMALLQGVAAIKCGPGESNRSHTPNEFITADELDAGVDFYTRLCTALLGSQS